MSSAYPEMIAADVVRIERALPGPIERVWAFLTESDRRSLWLAAGEMELRPGGNVALVFGNSELSGDDAVPPPKYAAHAGPSPLAGQVLECEPPRLLSFRWGGAAEASEVRFALTAEGAGVHLVVTHSRLSGRGQMLSVAGGWHTHLDILVDRMHGREPAGFWLVHARLEAEYERRLAQA